MSKVKFKIGTQSQYDSLTNKDDSTLYWIMDTQRIYKGETMFGVGADATSLAGGLFSFQDKMILTKLETFTQMIEYCFYTKPDGTIYNIDDHEIRVLCPQDAEWEKTRGIYYDAVLKLYAPHGAYYYRTILDGDLSSVAITPYTNTLGYDYDEWKRKFSKINVPLASCDSSNNWTYFGSTSASDNLFTYTLNAEWFDTNKQSIRRVEKKITLANESCYFSDPYFVSTSHLVDKIESILSTEVSVQEQIRSIVQDNISEGEIVVPTASTETSGTVKSSDEKNTVAVTSDGSMEVNDIGVEKISNTEGITLVLDGGSAN